ncbi:hypothetical protein RCL_jg12133.t1 [Rhizophagus clarus]|uniref:Uncharacterized protein n=1 Tax=Rhizophagus clarus TaxID=94130 RepID=A0A8H3L1X3_9GLOM|nr:hypothetical protein RCL_jg12133.t1 [Rhizophagus clarus]
MPSKYEIDMNSHLAYIAKFGSLETVELLFRTLEEISSKINSVELTKIGKNNDDLWNWLCKVQQRIKILRQCCQKKTELKAKEQIILQKNENIEKLTKKVGSMKSELNKERCRILR